MLMLSKGWVSLILTVISLLVVKSYASNEFIYDSPDYVIIHGQGSAYKARTNIEILKANNISRRAELLWCGFGQPKLVEPNSLILTSSGFEIHIETLTDSNKETFISGLCKKYDIGSLSLSQIIPVKNAQLKCYANIGNVTLHSEQTKNSEGSSRFVVEFKIPSNLREFLKGRLKIAYIDLTCRLSVINEKLTTTSTASTRHRRSMEVSTTLTDFVLKSIKDFFSSKNSTLKIVSSGVNDATEEIKTSDINQHEQDLIQSFDSEAENYPTITSTRTTPMQLAQGMVVASEPEKEQTGFEENYEENYKANDFQPINSKLQEEVDNLKILVQKLTDLVNSNHKKIKHICRDLKKKISDESAAQESRLSSLKESVHLNNLETSNAIGKKIHGLNQNFMKKIKESQEAESANFEKKLANLTGLVLSKHKEVEQNISSIKIQFAKMDKKLREFPVNKSIELEKKLKESQEAESANFEKKLANLTGLVLSKHKEVEQNISSIKIQFAKMDKEFSGFKVNHTNKLDENEQSKAQQSNFVLFQNRLFNLSNFVLLEYKKIKRNVSEVLNATQILESNILREIKKSRFEESSKLDSLISKLEKLHYQNENKNVIVKHEQIQNFNESINLRFEDIEAKLLMKQIQFDKLIQNFSSQVFKCQLLGDSFNKLSDDFMLISDSFFTLKKDFKTNFEKAVSRVGDKISNIDYMTVVKSSWTIKNVKRGLFTQILFASFPNKFKHKPIVIYTIKSYQVYTNRLIQYKIVSEEITIDSIRVKIEFLDGDIKEFIVDYVAIGY